MCSVLMFIPQFKPIIGGAERQAEKLAIALVKEGCSVTIITPRFESKSPFEESVQGVKICRFKFIDLSRHFPINGIGLINCPFIILQTTIEVMRRLSGTDILHAHIGSVETLGAVLAARLSSKPMLCKAAIADLRSDLGELEKRGLMGKIVSHVLRKATTCWIATTEAVSAALNRGGVLPERITAIANGVELKENIIIRKNPVRRFLYLGRLSTNIQRDTKSLILAFNKVASKYPNLELAIVGGGDLLEETRRQVNECAARNQIHVPGFSDPNFWLDWADCFVLPSVREGLSNALLEAMASGLVCIANDIPPNREVLADGRAGVLVPVGDVELLAKKINKTVTNNCFASKMRHAALIRVKQKYSIEFVAKKYVKLYENLINNRQSE